MADSFNILSRCASQLLRINRAQACIAFTVFDNVVSFVCDPVTQVEHLKENLPQDLVNEIAELKRQIVNVEFSERSDFVLFPRMANPYGLVLNALCVDNLRFVPIADPMKVYALVVVINASEENLSNNRTNITPFVKATANLFSIKQIRNFLPLKQKNKLANISGGGLVNNILSNVYHPVIFFSKDLKISRYNKYGMLLIQQSEVQNANDLRHFLEYFAAKIASQVVTQIENYGFVGKLATTEWHDVSFKLNSFQAIKVDLKILPITYDKAVGLKTDDELMQFALMINDNKRNELHSLQRFQALTSLIPLGILQIDRNFKCLYANDTWTKITALNTSSSLKDGWSRCFSSKDLHRIMPKMEQINLKNTNYSEELEIVSQKGVTKWVSLKGIGLFDEFGALDGFILTLDDISHVQEQKTVLENLANTDSLTGISNRNCFHDRLRVAISRVERHGNAAVLFIDLDKFKAINDTYGHHAGDAVIQQTAQRLHSIIRSEDTIARLGGDEFAILVSDVHNDNDVINLAIKIIIGIAKPMHIESNDLKVQCSIGIANIRHAQSTIKTVLKQADLAVYKAKSLGRNQYCVYTESLERETLLANYLRTSLQTTEATGFFLEYQPQVNATTNKIVGVEALSRWKHPKDVDVSPQEFILQLETHGLINDFFVWQLHSLLPIAKKWIDDELISSDCRLSINLSAVQLHLPNFARQILNTFKKYRVNCGCLGLEVTETAFMQDPLSAGENLRTLRSAGFSIALDDFGTGFSSLSLLRNMPLDTIKIDKEFIADILNNATDAKIVQSMITLSHELDLDVVAEGVETDAVKKWLDANKCPVQQGFHYYKPMADVQLERCLAKGVSLH